MIDLKDLKPGDALPTRQYTPTNVSLFLYNAIVWNPHRIHYDRDYTVNVEGHPEIVIDGPLQGDWLSQVVTHWAGDQGIMQSFRYSNRRASYLGETLTSGGAVKSVDADAGIVELDLFIKNADGDVLTPGSASVKFG